eukprot:363012-Chlamydomonas_euryale.AAC.5
MDRAQHCGTSGRAVTEHEHNRVSKRAYSGRGALQRGEDKDGATSGGNSSTAPPCTSSTLLADRPGPGACSAPCALTREPGARRNASLRLHGTYKRLGPWPAAAPSPSSAAACMHLSSAARAP